MATRAQLHRFDSYQPMEKKEAEVTERVFQSEHGLFQLKLNKGNDFNFEITTPTGETILDNFHWIEDREHLYRLLGKNVYEWLQKSFEDKLGEVMVNADGYTIMKVIDDEQYTLTIDPETKNCRLEYPALFREFHIYDIYLTCPELPLLYDGKLDQHFRDELSEFGVDMPDSPYISGLKLRPKYV